MRNKAQATALAGHRTAHHHRPGKRTTPDSPPVMSPIKRPS